MKRFPFTLYMLLSVVLGIAPTFLYEVWGKVFSTPSILLLMAMTGVYIRINWRKEIWGAPIGLSWTVAFLFTIFIIHIQGAASWTNEERLQGLVAVFPVAFAAWVLFMWSALFFANVLAKRNVVRFD